MTSGHPRELAALAARFPRKRAFITGAASGLGLQIAQALASDGWVLGLYDRNVAQLAKVEAEFSEKAIPALAYPGDVTQSDELTVAVNSFAATYDGLDLMVNNAGVAVGGGLMEVPLEDWRWIIDINVMGVVHGCRAALPHLQRNGCGLIINISSAAAFVSPPGMAPYTLSKAAVLSLSEALAAELRGGGTQVSVVMPTFFESSLLDSFRGPESSNAAAKRLMKASDYSAAEVAYSVLRQAGKGQIHIVLPRHARWLWKAKRWLPSFFVRRVARIHEKGRAPRSG